MRGVPLLVILVASCGGGGSSSGVDAAPAVDAGAPDATLSPTACNGRDELCDRRLDEIALPKTHNSHASEERFFNPAAMNQFPAVPRQLVDGVRALNFDVYHQVDELTDDLWVCHGFCALGWQPFVDVLSEVRYFLDHRPREVLTLELESYITAAQAAGAFQDAGLMPYLHEQPEGEPWPTLAEMIASGRRLVVFTDAEGGAYPWYHDDDRYVFSTPWGEKQPADLDCETSPPIAHGLFNLTHTLTDPIAQPELAEMINHNPFFIDRAHQCEAEVGHRVNLVEVDFYTIGDLFDVVDELNGF